MGGFWGEVLLHDLTNDVFPDIKERTIVNVIIINDLMESACQNDEAEKAFTDYVRDKKKL